MWDKVASSYFSKQANFKELDLIMPKEDLGIIVVIPCFNEPDLKLTLESISKCSDPGCGVLVLVVVNFPVGSTETVKQQCESNVFDVAQWQQNYSYDWLAFQSIELFDVPMKDAGVGFARKVGMDQAAYTFFKLGVPQGVIDCFDADSLCDANYLFEIARQSQQHMAMQAASIYYEHPVAGLAFSENLYEGIANYELHLRYYVWALRSIKFPYAFQTVGSSMLCRASSYVRYGGMNRRKAGEDFYFLQKIIPHGGFFEITSTRVIPSPRISERVPFGTGRAMLKMSELNSAHFVTYSLDSIQAVGVLFGLVERLYHHKELAQLEILLHPSLQQYLHDIDWVDAVREVQANASTLENFMKRFFLWFNAFRVLKYLNYAHDGWFEKKPVVIEAERLLRQLGHTVISQGEFGVLMEYRRMDRQGWSGLSTIQR